MGMYNIIKTNIKCVKCNEKVDEWQSKYLTYNGYLLANGLQKIKLDKCFITIRYIEYNL